MSLLMDNPLNIPTAGRPASTVYEVKGDIGLSISFSAKDFPSAKLLLDQIGEFESMANVPLLISIMGGTAVLNEREWLDFRQKALGIFKSASTNAVRFIRDQSTEGNRDWRPNNMMFRGVVDWYQHFGADKVGAFYYLEPDCAILKRDWFSTLCAEYRMAHKPFMGVIRTASTKAGAALPNHMNGSGFYPNPVARYSLPLYAASQNNHPEAAPFDVAGGATVTPLCKATKLICVDFTPTPQINSEAVVWHGDKSNQCKLAMLEGSGPVFREAMAEKPSSIKASLQGIPEIVAPVFRHGHISRYEAYLTVLRAYGYDGNNWGKAIKAYRAENPEAAAKSPVARRVVKRKGGAAPVPAISGKDPMDI